MRIATLGPQGTFSHQAVLKYNKNAEIVFKNTIKDIFDSVKNREVEKGIVPIENSVSGSVGITLDALMEYNLKICEELILPVRHSLASNGSMKDIKRLYVHPQALSQCQKFVHEHLNNAEVLLTGSNALSARDLSKNKKKEYAAIVPNHAAKDYNLKILSKNIQDSNFNVTRFIVLDAESAKKTGIDRTSIAIYPHTDKPGLLYGLIGEFATRKINLTKIESRPSKGRLGDYIFFIDLQVHKDDDKVKEAFEAIEHDFFLKVLGSYPREY